MWPLDGTNIHTPLSTVCRICVHSKLVYFFQYTKQKTSERMNSVWRACTFPVASLSSCNSLLNNIWMQDNLSTFKRELFPIFNSYRELTSAAEACLNVVWHSCSDCRHNMAPYKLSYYYYIDWLIDWLELKGTFSTVRLHRAFRSYRLRFVK